MTGDSDDQRSSEGGVVDPNELDIEDDEHVKALGDNRYVVSPDDPIADQSDSESVNGDTGGEPRRQSETDDHAGSEAGESSSQYQADSVQVHEARARLTSRMVELRGAYGFDIIAQFGDEVVQQHRQANDIVSVFDALLLWYAAHLDDETPPEQAIGILLAESDIPVEYPADVLIDLVQTHGLNSDDTIGDLIDAACDQTVQFPPK